MAVIETFLKILSPLNIYNLSENTNVYKELMTYAQELDLINLQLDILLRESFIITAEDYGLSLIEKIYTAPSADEDNSLRRERILNRLNIDDSCFTLEKIKNSITGFGAENFQILEFPDRYNIVVEIYGDYDETKISFIKNEVRKIMPAHQKNEVYFNGISWVEIDSQALSFDSMDAKAYSWNSIDEIKI